MRHAMLLVAILVAQPVAAPQDNFKAIFAKHWRMAKEFTLAVAEAMPAESYDFKPTPEQMTFGRLMTHIGAQNSDSCAVATGTTALPEAAAQDKATAIKYLTDTFDACANALEAMPPERLGTEVYKFQGTAGARARGALIHVHAHGPSSRTGGSLPAREEHHAAGVALLGAARRNRRSRHCVGWRRVSLRVRRSEKSSCGEWSSLGVHRPRQSTQECASSADRPMKTTLLIGVVLLGVSARPSPPMSREAVVGSSVKTRYSVLSGIGGMDGGTLRAELGGHTVTLVDDLPVDTVGDLRVDGKVRILVDGRDYSNPATVKIRRAYRDANRYWGYVYLMRLVDHQEKTEQLVVTQSLGDGTRSNGVNVPERSGRPG